MFGRKKKTPNGAWVVAVDMGYGHLRAALPLKSIAQDGKIVTANAYEGIPQSDKNVWEDSRRLYEIVSRFTKFPVLGDFVFALFDKFQEIKDFYPLHENVEAPTLQLKQVYRLIRDKKWGKHLVDMVNKKSLIAGRQALPFVTTFFIPAYMAEYWGYEGQIYLVIPDTDISRAWAPFTPSASKIVYCASTERAAARLKRYGVPGKNIVLTGFPLPVEFTKNNAAKAKKDLRRRLGVLDPNRRYLEQYGKVVEQYLGRPQGPTLFRSRSGLHKIVLTFAIGGAGAQAELAADIMEGAKPLLLQKKLELHIIAGIHREIALKLKEKAGKNVFVHFSPTKKKYFRDFSDTASKSDILWTKPSELVFYAGLGIPIIIAPPIGSQEKFNRKWLLESGAGIDQKKPELTHEWLPDLLEKGALAKAAMQGFIEIPKDGRENIKKLILKSEARSTKSETNSNE